MAVTPQTVYARDGDVNLAYQLAGSFGPDLLFVPTPRFPIDLIWDDYTVAGHLRRLGSEAALRKLSGLVGETAGTGAATELLAPSWSHDAAKRRWYGRGERLVVPGHAKYVAERIPHSWLVELDGDDHEWFAGDSDAVLDEIGSFLTGARRSRPSNRVLSTVLFTGIVGSTERATALGDQAWNSILAAHNLAVEREACGACGRVVKFTGDGALARSTAHAQFETRSGIWACIFAPDCTPVR